MSGCMFRFLSLVIILYTDYGIGTTFLIKRERGFRSLARGMTLRVSSG